VQEQNQFDSENNQQPEENAAIPNEIIAPQTTETKPLKQRLKPVLIGLVLISIAFFLWNKWNQPKNDGSFKYNFVKPESLVADNALRVSEIAEGDSNLTRPSYCEELLQLSDQSFQNKAWEAAIDPLLMMALDTTGFCASDAYFYLGILQLELNDPMLAIQCFAKIENFTKFGEDIQWYQALAILQLNEQDDHYKERAIGAMNNIQNSAQKEDKKERARFILDKLNK
jgi:hypothetical protein